MKKLCTLIFLFAAGQILAEAQTASLEESEALSDDVPAGMTYAQALDAVAQQVPGLSEQSYKNLIRTAYSPETRVFNEQAIANAIKVAQWIVLTKSNVRLQASERALAIQGAEREEATEG